MTEKRFVQYSNLVMQDNKIYVVCDNERSADVVTTALNELINENEQLKNNIGEQGVRLDFAICETQDFKNKWFKLKKENEQLKQVLGAILLEVKRDITNINQTGEIRVFINPNSFNLISEVLRKYGVLKEWYE